MKGPATRKDRDSTPTEPRGLAAIGRRKTTAPITKPIHLRTDDRTNAEKRVGELLTAVIAGRGSLPNLWAYLQRQSHWNLAPDTIQQRRWVLFHDVITRAAQADVKWRSETPRTCAAGPRTPIDHCTARDTCDRHRQHLGKWWDIELAATRELLYGVPERASVEPETPTARKGGRR